MYCNGVYSSHSLSRRLWAVVCVLLVCPHIFFQLCAANYCYTFYVIEMKPDKHDELTVMYSNEHTKKLWARVAQLVEHLSCKQRSCVRSTRWVNDFSGLSTNGDLDRTYTGLPLTCFRSDKAIYVVSYHLSVDVQDRLNKIYRFKFTKRFEQFQHMLPFTSASAKYYSFSWYFRVQEWIGMETHLQPTDCV